MLTFELADGGQRVEIHGDREGLLHLASILTSLADEKLADHVHLMTDEWGGNELTNVVQGLRNVLVNHAKIFIWPKA